MLTRRLIRQIPKRYSTISFTPNENKHIFESEKLSPKENYDAIPDRPDFSTIDKIHHEIVNPEEVADLVTKLNTNDVLITMLSKNKHLYGDKGYVIRSEGNENPVFPYSSILLSWKDVYNKQIKDLKEIEPVTFTYPAVDTKYFSLLKDTSLEEFFHKSRAIKNSTSIKKGKVQPSEVKNLFTVESASNVALSAIDSISALEEYMSFIPSKVQFFTFQGLRDLLSSVVLLSDKFPVSGSTVDHLVTAIVSSHPKVLQALDHDIKDKLAHSLIDSNTELATTIIKDLIDESVCPSERTFNKYIGNYEAKDAETTLKELSFLKSAIHHHKMNETTFNLLIQTVTNINELIKFVTLLKRTPGVLQDKQNQLYSKLRLLTTSELTTTQFVRFLTKNDVKLSPELKERLMSDYNNDPEVVTVINRL